MSDSRKLISNSSMLFAATIVASFFSYLFNMLMGRFLGPSSYGELTAVLSLIAIVSVVGSAVTTVSMRYSNEMYASARYGELHRLFVRFTRYMVLLALVLFVFGVVLAPLVSAVLHIPDKRAIVISFVSLFFGLSITVNRGIMQGTQMFRSLAASSIVEMASKLALGVLLVKLGFGVDGAVAAIVLATALVYVATYVPVARLVASVRQPGLPVVYLNRSEILRYAAPAFMATLFLVFLLNIDIILVKAYFSPADAGLYAAVSTVAKIILYVSAPIISVMFPMIAERQTKGEKHYKTFLLAMLLTLVTSMMALAVYAVVPGLILRVLYGVAYVQLYYILPVAGLYIVLYSMVNLAANYFLAVKDFVFIWYMGVALVAQAGLAYLYHPSIDVVVRILAATTAALFAAMIGRYLFMKRVQLRSWLEASRAS